MKLETVTAGSDALALADAKAFLRVDHSDEDALIQALISGVQQKAEAYCGKSFTTRTLRVTYYAPIYRRDHGIYTPPRSVLHHLPMGPVTSVTSVETLNADGTVDETVSSDDYSLQGNELRYSATQTFRVTYEAGFTTVPPGVLEGLKREVRSHYFERDDVVTGRSVTELSNNAKLLFDVVREVRL